MITAHIQRTWSIIATGVAMGVLIFGLGATVHAQAGDVPPDAEVSAQHLFENNVPAGNISCFDYYTFGSVQAQLVTRSQSAASGTSVHFSGAVENKNAYPVVDGVLFVKVFKKRAVHDGNGNDVVGEFVAATDMVIPAYGKKEVAFSWVVPAYATSGEYYIATFFTTSRKFNLLGLSFTDDVVGNTVPFSVVGEQESLVGFVKSGATIQGEPYLFTSFAPHTDKVAPVTVSVPVRNTGSTAERARIHWTTYQWDAQLRENVVHESTQDITVPARGTVPVTYTVTDATYPVYVVKGVLSWKDTTSIIGARFVRDDIDRPRINFPSVTSFPLEKGTEVTLFSCLHNTGSAPRVNGGRLDITLSDMDGTVIHEYRYEGDITGSMMGVADVFVPTETYDQFVLDARLYRDGVFVDEAHLVYDCNTIAPGTCIEKKTSSSLFNTGGDMFLRVLGMLGGVVLIIVLFMVVRAMRQTRPAAVPPSGEQI